MNFSKTALSLTFLLLLSFFFQNNAWAQTDKELLAEIVSEEQDAVNALIMYPSDTRLAIFNTTPYPEALIKMESLQSRTSSSFNNLLEDYPRETQQTIWDLTRYPNLINGLVSLGEGNHIALDGELKKYAEVIHPRARRAYKDHYAILQAIDELNHSAEQAFAGIIQPYPEVTQLALRELKELPEVLTLLTDNIRLTLLVGSVYVDDPAWLIAKADSLYEVVAQQNAEELKSWKRSLQEDPEALQELQASTESYAEEYGFDDEYYDYDHDYDAEVPTEVIVRHHYYYSYPYWFGYPSWYTIPRWRCYPLYYDWGFYQHPGFNLVIIGLPNYHYTNWYFYNHHHHYYWPHLSGHFVNHYYGHRHSASSITTSVTIWQRQNREVVTRGWLKDDGRLPERFKEFGKFEAEREKYNKANPGRQVSQKDFAKKQIKTYPNLAKNAEQYEAERQIRKPVTQKPPVTRKPKVQPDKDKSKIKTPPTRVPPKKQPTTRPDITKPKKPTIRKVDPPKTSRPVPPRTTPKKTTTRKKMPEVKKGENYHQQTWEKSKKTRKPTSPRIKTAPKKPQVKKPTKTSPRKKTVGDN